MEEQNLCVKTILNLTSNKVPICLIDAYNKEKDPRVKELIRHAILAVMDQTTIEKISKFAADLLSFVQPPAETEDRNRRYRSSAVLKVLLDNMDDKTWYTNADLRKILRDNNIPSTSLALALGRGRKTGAIRVLKEHTKFFLYGTNNLKGGI